MTTWPKLRDDNWFRLEDNRLRIKLENCITRKLGINNQCHWVAMILAIAPHAARNQALRALSGLCR